MRKEKSVQLPVDLMDKIALTARLSKKTIKRFIVDILEKIFNEGREVEVVVKCPSCGTVIRHIAKIDDEFSSAVKLIKSATADTDEEAEPEDGKEVKSVYI